jgi:succinate dehydrogenase / fumarate reductase cytochrome b subunit
VLPSPPAAEVKERKLNWLTAALRSSVGKKFVMGVTGLFLCFFLVVHLVGNLLLYAGADAYNRYAHALHDNVVFLFTAQVLLYAAFIAHIYLAFVTSAENREARGEQYAVKRTKRADRIINPLGWSPDTTMFVTGAVVLGFLIVHLADFKFGDVFHAELVAGREPFDRALLIMAGGTRMLIYVVGSLFLGVHVCHGFASAFQSLGVNHPKYNRCIAWASLVFALVVAAGFSLVAISAWSGMGRSAPAPTGDRMAPDAPAGHAHPHAPSQ